METGFAEIPAQKFFDLALPNGILTKSLPDKLLLQGDFVTFVTVLRRGCCAMFVALKKDPESLTASFCESGEGNLPEPIFDREATLVAWLNDDENVIHDLGSRPVALISDRAVYSFNCQHLGYFDRGFFRDKEGLAVAFTPARSGGPLDAIAPLRPMGSPRLGRVPVPQRPPAAPAMPTAGFLWSSVEWRKFIF